MARTLGAPACRLFRASQQVINLGNTGSQLIQLISKLNLPPSSISGRRR
jgi:hypothetical protein